MGLLMGDEAGTFCGIRIRILPKWDCNHSNIWISPRCFTFSCWIFTTQANNHISQVHRIAKKLKRHQTVNFSHINITLFIWLVVSTPLKNMSQLGWWHSQCDGKNKSHVPNHQPVIVSQVTSSHQRIQKKQLKMLLLTPSLCNQFWTQIETHSRPWFQDRQSNCRAGSISWRYASQH